MTRLSLSSSLGVRALAGTALLVLVITSSPALAQQQCYDFSATPEVNSSLSGMLGHRIDTGITGQTNAQCNVICQKFPALYNVQYSGEVQFGGINSCVCYGNLTTALSAIPSSSACGPCSDPPGKAETCGSANALNGFITGTPLIPVTVQQPSSACLTFNTINGTYYGPTGTDNTWGGRLKTNTGNPAILDAASCNAFCAASSKTVTYSSMVQIGGQLGCTCASLSPADYATLLVSTNCQACQKLPPVTPPPNLGNCGTDNAMDGVISSLALTPTSNLNAVSCYNIENTTEFNNSLQGMLGHRMETGNFSVTNAQCLGICSGYPSSYNIQYSGIVQYGGMNECVCYGNMTTPLASIPSSDACAPCSNPPGASETCGQANALNGYINGTPLFVVAPKGTATSTGLGATATATATPGPSQPTSSAAAATTTASAAATTTSKPSGAGSVTASRAAFFVAVLGSAMLFF